MLLRLMISFASLLLLTGCGTTVSRDSNPKILTMGDSLLASNRLTGMSVAEQVGKNLDEPIVDKSTIGARMIYNLPISGAAGLRISKQFRAGKWDWIVLNGGGNDLWIGCGCMRCDRKMDKLVKSDGSGEIPDLVNRLRSTGARVVYVGYLRSPGVGSLIEHCRDDGDELERRITAFADTDDGVWFVSLKDMVPSGDRSYHAADMIHPSIKASGEIAERVADVIRDNAG